MRKTPIFNSLTGIAFVVAFILTSCNSVATTAAPTSGTATQSPVISPIAATATLPPAATATAAPIPTATATVAPTATTQLTAQVAPSINANCRKGPGTGYYVVTFLQEETVYNVIGRNSLNTWWLVQAPGNVTCWMGDMGASQLGPVDQAPIALVQPLPVTPAKFVDSYKCNTTLHTLDVVFNWSAVTNVTGYRIYRNGTQITDAGPTATAYSDSSAPTKESLVYALEAHNDYGVAARITVSVPACN